MWSLDNRRGSLKNYGGEELNLSTLAAFIPADKWSTRAGKREIIAALPFTLSEVAAEVRRFGNFRDAVDDMLSDVEPSGWSRAVDYFDTMEAVAALAGIPCYSTQSNGYSQGDSALVFVAALPAWVESVGAAPETLANQCKAACDLWSAWAWGDVYGFVLNDP
ncbi:MAG TPA: hypothetical protein VLB09_00610, partial [Nitrospiria bacterium]|nr:hypothetical protein [Nitrospiria bacterium]